MLSKTSAKRSDDAAVRAYLHETFGIMAEVREWTTGELPYFLQEAFQIRELKLLDRRILLAFDQRVSRPGMANVRVQIDKLRQLTGMPVVYVTHTLASYERKRLIEQKVPFLVPGNQLYLPDLGIDLREYFRQRAFATQSALSPATQAVLIAVLLQRPWRAEWQPAEVVGELGYTPMTLSRAVRELVAAGIATLRTEGRVRWLHMDRTAAQTWEHARPVLRSPVKRRTWVLAPSKSGLPAWRLSGLSALARYSLLAEPQWPTYAVSQAEWKAAKQAGVETLPEPTSGACELEIWHYSPALERDSDAVDALSLTLSLQINPDERVQLALDELKGYFPW